jgi:hypothetical protein
VRTFWASAFAAYSTDLWSLAPHSATQLGGAYEGPKVTARSYVGASVAETYAADPTIWLPMREAEKARTAIGRAPAAAAPIAPGAMAGHVAAGARPSGRALRDDVVLQLPAGHAVVVWARHTASRRPRC